jgi:hypothetical protein
MLRRKRTGEKPADPNVLAALREQIGPAAAGSHVYPSLTRTPSEEYVPTLPIEREGSHRGSLFLEIGPASTGSHIYPPHQVLNKPRSFSDPEPSRIGMKTPIAPAKRFPVSPNELPNRAVCPPSSLDEYRHYNTIEDEMIQPRHTGFSPQRRPDGLRGRGRDLRIQVPAIPIRTSSRNAGLIMQSAQGLRLRRPSTGSPLSEMAASDEVVEVEFGQTNSPDNIIDLGRDLLGQTRE